MKQKEKNHIDLSTISLLQKSSHLVQSSGCRKSENYLKRRSKTHEKNQTKYISKIHQDGRSIEEFKKDEKRRKKIHNLCQPISN
jgi:superfamily I DNA and/or RNA helicase